MSSLTITATVLCCVVAGAALGMWLGYRLPEPHRSAQSHDAIKLATGMLSVLAALVLGLLIASVKNAFDTTDSQIRHFSATLILLSQTLADYGPETADARDMLRHYTDRALADNWPADKATPVKMRMPMPESCSTACAPAFWSCRRTTRGTRRCVPRRNHWLRTR